MYIDTATLNPDYMVKYYREGLYRLVKFHRPLSPRIYERQPDDTDRGEGKLSQALSRARSVVLQLALCNDWDFFCTFTIDKTQFNRYELNTYYKAFAQWIRDYRKEYGCKIEYCLIPEQHEDGAWHMHGFMRGIPQSHLTPFVRGLHPDRLVDGHYLNWGRYAKKFGFCSFGEIRDAEACAFYITKYVTKAFDRGVTGYGAHLYYASIGLRRAVPCGDIYGHYSVLDDLLEEKFQFCSVGFVRDVDWRFWMDYCEVDEWEDCGGELPDEVSIDVSSGADAYVEILGEQLSLFSDLSDLQEGRGS
ncbi:MAG: hypothetical protein J6A62_08585 [Oscillospiraceae bacterium]|nr:hypothetical protein [Oscillospiraceae bacterium]